MLQPRRRPAAVSSQELRLGDEGRGENRPRLLRKAQLAQSIATLDPAQLAQLGLRQRAAEVGVLLQRLCRVHVVSFVVPNGKTPPSTREGRADGVPGEASSRWECSNADRLFSGWQGGQNQFDRIF
jgi:hypothetical protein